MLSKETLASKMGFCFFCYDVMKAVSVIWTTYCLSSRRSLCACVKSSLIQKQEDLSNNSLRRSVHTRAVLASYQGLQTALRIITVKIDHDNNVTAVGFDSSRDSEASPLCL